MYKNGQFIKFAGYNPKRLFIEVKKSSNPLQPFFEAITNSLESIWKSGLGNKGSIQANFYLNKGTDSRLFFEKLEILDNGIGFNEEEFARFCEIGDDSKGFNNKGTGRIQFGHFFDKTKFKSTYKGGDGKFNYREFVFSKSDTFLKNHSIIQHIRSENDVDDIVVPSTKIIFETLTDKKDGSFYCITPSEIIIQLLKHYLLVFCNHKKEIPEIAINQYIQGELADSKMLDKNEVPDNVKKIPFELHYKKLSDDGKEVIASNNKEEFILNAFKISSKLLDLNTLSITNKGEISEFESGRLKIKCISTKDTIDDSRYLFLLSSEYFNKRESDVRGVFNIPTLSKFKTEPDVFYSEEIFLDDIELNVNREIESNFPEILEKNREHLERVEILKSMFLLNDEFFSPSNISMNDSESDILEKYYIAESKAVAKQDASIKEIYDSIIDLDPSSSSYSEELNVEIDKFVKTVPLQNRKALTHYVARRKLVLDLFDRILNSKLKVQSAETRKKNEELIHNLIFKQGSINPETSDLWLLNEDFVLFEGNSEKKLEDIKYKGETIFKADSELSKEELEFKNSLGENRYAKRPDIILFPQESKCIIVELKDPDKNPSDYIPQIQNYASLIRNFSKDKFEFDTFYGYLLGENMNYLDLKSKHPHFKNAYHFDYYFSPHTPVPAFFGKRKDIEGSIYMEAIKYSTLLDKASQRNKVFIDKLTTKI